MLAALLFSAGVVWFVTRSEAPPPTATAPQPTPVAAAAPSAPPLKSEPEPAPAPEPDKPLKPKRAPAPAVAKTKREASAPATPPVSAATLVSKAQDELVSGHMSAALTLYEQATREDAQNAAAFRGLGLVNERLGHKSAALRALRRAIALTPNDPKNRLLREHIERLEAGP